QVRGPVLGRVERLDGDRAGPAQQLDERGVRDPDLAEPYQPADLAPLGGRERHDRLGRRGDEVVEESLQLLRGDPEPDHRGGRSLERGEEERHFGSESPHGGEQVNVTGAPEAGADHGPSRSVSSPRSSSGSRCRLSSRTFRIGTPPMEGRWIVSATMNIAWPSATRASPARIWARWRAVRRLPTPVRRISGALEKASNGARTVTVTSRPISFSSSRTPSRSGSPVREGGCSVAGRRRSEVSGSSAFPAGVRGIARGESKMVIGETSGSPRKASIRSTIVISAPAPSS